MLNHTKLITALHQFSDELFANYSHEWNIIKQVWDRIATDATFPYRVRETNAPWPIPTWTEDLGATYAIKPFQNRYYALSVDGSQIYPDRHQSIACYLINIGSVIVPYALDDGVCLQSDPYLFQGKDTLFDAVTSTEMVNAKRQELELQAGYNLASALQKRVQKSDIPQLLLFDGSLIFWHLSSHSQETRAELLTCYLNIISQLYHQNILCAWYISMPKSKELISLVRLSLCDFVPEQTDLYEVTNYFVDATIAQYFLTPHHRSIVFQNNAPVSEEYHPLVRPYFFYINTGYEIGRVELPAWIAHNVDTVDLVAQLICDQCNKGQGYPVVLAEAHEQAVVKGVDREFFYHLIEKIGLAHKRRPIISKKSLKKQRVSV